MGRHRSTLPTEADMIGAYHAERSLRRAAAEVGVSVSHLEKVLTRNQIARYGRSELSLSGKRFGAWHVITKASRPEGGKELGTYWLAECYCGKREVVSGHRLSSGRLSRGCATCRGHGATKGGLTPEYQSWRGMRERCISPSHSSYDRYGGRGITVCARWLHSFPAFLQDMGHRPSGHTLDRIDNDGNYEPSNCRWADARTQVRNSSGFKLTDEQVVAIRNAINLGVRQIDIALMCGVERSHIANIAVGSARAS